MSNKKKEAKIRRPLSNLAPLCFAIEIMEKLNADKTGSDKMRKWVIGKILLKTAVDEIQARIMHSTTQGWAMDFKRTSSSSR